MRKFNAVLTVLIMLLFLLHGILGSFQMLGVGSTALKGLARLSIVLIVIHIVIGLKYTIDTLRVLRKTKCGYFKQNALFWARRISGLAVMVLLLFHITAFGDYGTDTYRLKWFTAAKLVIHLLLALSLAVHIITNVKPVLITFGIRGIKEYAPDILIVLSAVLLFMAIAFFVYYLRWNGF